MSEHPLRAATRAELAWTALLSALDLGDDRNALAYGQQLRRLLDEIDDPYLEAVSHLALAWVAPLLGDRDEALREALVVALRQGRFDEAWALLDKALTLSQGVRNTHMLTVCLDAVARLAFAAGRAEPAARLAGAAEGLRRRARMRTWPMMRYLEAEVAAEGRRKLGPEHFDQAFTAGLALTQREAVEEAHALHDASAGPRG
jgi:tetratricopeptide (TPR) repeat protein